MSSYFSHARHGPLPALLLLLTFGTGVVDATSILGLGRVFVANMTGNIVFIGFGIAGAPGFSIRGSLIALTGFLLGAAVGGAGVDRLGSHRGRLLRDALLAEVLLFAIASVTAASEASLDLGRQLVVLALEALALGIQNAVVRQLAVPDMTTTVSKMTLCSCVPARDGSGRDSSPLRF